MHELESFFSRAEKTPTAPTMVGLDPVACLIALLSAAAVLAVGFLALVI
jgi:hypothetical protein